MPNLCWVIMDRETKMPTERFYVSLSIFSRFTSNLQCSRAANTRRVYFPSPSITTQVVVIWLQCARQHIFWGSASSILKKHMIHHGPITTKFQKIVIFLSSSAYYVAYSSRSTSVNMVIRAPENSSSSVFAVL